MNEVESVKETREGLKASENKQKMPNKEDTARKCKRYAVAGLRGALGGPGSQAGGTGSHHSE